MENSYWSKTSQEEINLVLALKSNLWTKPAVLAKKLRISQDDVTKMLVNLFKNRHLLPIVHVNWNTLDYSLYSVLLRINPDESVAEQRHELVRKLIKNNDVLYVWENHDHFNYSIGVFTDGNGLEASSFFNTVLKDDLIGSVKFDKVDRIYKEAGRYDAVEYRGIVTYSFCDDALKDSALVGRYIPDEMKGKEIKFLATPLKKYRMSATEQRIVTSVGQNPMLNIKKLAAAVRISRLRALYHVSSLLRRKIIVPTVIVKDEPGTNWYQIFVKISSYLPAERILEIKNHLLNLDYFCVAVSLTGTNYDFVLAAHTCDRRFLDQYIERNVLSCFRDELSISVVHTKWIQKVNTIDISQKTAEDRMPNRYYPWGSSLDCA